MEVLQVPRAGQTKANLRRDVDAKKAARNENTEKRTVTGPHHQARLGSACLATVTLRTRAPDIARLGKVRTCTRVRSTWTLGTGRRSSELVGAVACRWPAHDLWVQEQHEVCHMPSKFERTARTHECADFGRCAESLSLDFGDDLVESAPSCHWCDQRHE